MLPHLVKVWALEDFPWISRNGKPNAFENYVAQDLRFGDHRITCFICMELVIKFRIATRNGDQFTHHRVVHQEFHTPLHKQPEGVPCWKTWRHNSLLALVFQNPLEEIQSYLSRCLDPLNAFSGFFVGPIWSNHRSSQSMSERLGLVPSPVPIPFVLEFVGQLP